MAIVNALSTDLDGTSESENGVFMRRVLEECATLRDVELLLLATNGNRKTLANFGVIDGRGGGLLVRNGGLESVIFRAAGAALERWRDGSVEAAEVRMFQEHLAGWAYLRYLAGL